MRTASPAFTGCPAFAGHDGIQACEISPVVYGAGAPATFPPCGGASLRPLRGEGARDAGGKPEPHGPVCGMERSTQEATYRRSGSRPGIPRAVVIGSFDPAPDGLTLLSIAEEGFRCRRRGYSPVSASVAADP